jgi:hypothetical protein
VCVSVCCSSGKQTNATKRVQLETTMMIGLSEAKTHRMIEISLDREQGDTTTLKYQENAQKSVTGDWGN